MKPLITQLQNIKRLSAIAVLAMGAMTTFAQQSPIDVTWVMWQNEA